jgi:hypothetical protein
VTAILLPSTAYVKCMETDEVAKAGSIDLTEHTELHAIRVLLYKYGLIVTTERMRAKIYTDSDYTKLLYTSDWADVADVGAGEFWGWMRLDFDRKFLHKLQTYYVAIEVGNYTYSDSSFLALSLDWPVQQNTGSVQALAMQIYGYRETD